MNKKIVGILICILLIGIAIPQFGFLEIVKADPGDVIISFDSPGDVPYGLAWDGNYLWSSDWIFCTIYKIDPFDGSIINSFNSPGTHPKGIAWDGEYLWNADSFDNKIYKLNPSDGSIIDSINTLIESPVGIAWDGDFFWHTAMNDNDKIYKIDPLNGNVIDVIDNEEYRANGLSWNDNFLWISDSYRDKIYKIDPFDGSIFDSFNSPGNCPTGLTWDGQYLWNADSNENKIYKIDVGGNGEESDIIIDEVSGGFGVSASIFNNGMECSYNVSWSIDVEASIGIILSGSHKEDIINEIDANETITIQSNNLRGIGLITITIQVADTEKQATAFLLGPLILRVNEI